MIKTRLCQGVLNLYIVAMICACAGLNSEIRTRSAQWNYALSERDVAKLMSLFSPDAHFATAGGKWSGKDAGQRGFSSLFEKRPDLKWEIRANKIMVNEAWEVAYETGDWLEWWREPDGDVKIEGAYFMMWKKKGREPWLIHAAIFTPLLCAGKSAYCKPHEASR